jgi:hypothetical protein
MKIKNWAKFQHFKDRKPPWVKLYRDILDDVEWFELDSKLAKILVMLWLIASEEQNGELPDSKKLAFRLRLTEKEINTAIIGLSHWLEQSDTDAISSRYQSDLPETETETETETKREAEKKGRATRLQDNWQPSDDMIQFCLQERPDLDWKFVSEGFRDYWISQAGAKGRKADWSATWRNWVRNQRKSFGSNQPANGKTQNQINADRVLAELRGLENAR